MRYTLVTVMLSIAPCIYIAISMDCTGGSDKEGSLTLLRGQGEDVVFSTVHLPPAEQGAVLTDVSAVSLVGANLTVDLVSKLQHERTITTAGWTACLLDGAVVLLLSSATYWPTLPFDTEQCLPHQLFQHSSSDMAFLLCSRMSQVMIMAQTQAGFELSTTLIQAEQGLKYLNVPAVPLYHPEYKTTAAFIHFGLTDDGYDKTWLTLVTNLESGANLHYTICDDTYYEGRESCATEHTSISPYNDTYFLLVCRETASSDKKRFLVDAFSNNGNCGGIVGKTLVPSGGEAFVGPDKDTIAVNLGQTVAVSTNDFTQSYSCITEEGVERIDFITTESGLSLLLFTSNSILTCAHGQVNVLAAFSLLEAAFPYYIDGYRLFVTQYSSSTYLYTISLFDAQQGCQVQYPNSGPISTLQSPLLYMFIPEALQPTSTSTTMPSPSSTNFSPDSFITIVTLVPEETSVLPAMMQPSIIPTSPPATGGSSPQPFAGDVAAVVLSAMVFSIFVALVVTILILAVCRKRWYKSTYFRRGSECGMPDRCHSRSTESMASVTQNQDSPIQETVIPLSMIHPIQAVDD